MEFASAAKWANSPEAPLDRPRKKFYLVSSSQGCVSNLLETTTLRHALNPALYEAVSAPELADIILVNTCGYNQPAEGRSIGLIAELQAKFPDKKVIVSGCLPRINPARLQDVFQGDVVRTGDLPRLNEVLEPGSFDPEKIDENASALHPQELSERLSGNQILQWIYPWYKGFVRRTGLRFHPLHNILESSVFDDRTFALTVSSGCLGRCNFCAIKRAKGRLVSRPLDEVRQKFEGALAQGFSRFHLVADDVGCWGQDLGSDSAQLLAALLAVPGDFQLVIEYFDPYWLLKYYPRLEGLLSDRRVICLNAPIQSGSSRLLRDMGRDYSAEEVLDRLARLKALNPELVVKTHLMVGYPGESESDYRESLASLGRFDLVFANEFGPRPGTPAAKLPQLPGAVKKRRLSRLQGRIFLRHLRVLLTSFAQATRTRPCISR